MQGGRRALVILSSLGLGLTQYLQDYDSRYPQASAPAAPITATSYGAFAVELFPPNAFGTPPSSHPRNLTWAAVLLPYTKSPQIMACPSQKELPWYGNTSSFNIQMPVSYTYNKLLAWNSEADVVKPERTIVIHEGFGELAYTSVVAAFPVVNTPAGAPYGPATPYKFNGVGGRCTWYGGATATERWVNGRLHLKTTPFLYGDGHVKAIIPVGLPPKPWIDTPVDGGMVWRSYGDACMFAWQYEGED